MNSDKIQLYEEYFGPPKEWKLKDAKAYRKALGGYTKGGELKRFAPIGNISMGNPDIPDSFPFYKFTNETPSPDEILRRGEQILQMLNKYDPYADKTFMDVKFENVEIPDISLLDELMKPEVRPKDPVVAYLQSLPEKPGPRLNIKSDVNSYQTADYDIDTLVNWINVPQAGSDIAGVHRALILNAGNYLLQLALEHEKDKECIRECIDYELKQYMRYGTNGKYVHRYNINAVVDAMGKTPGEGTKRVKVVTSERDPKTGRWRDTSRYEDRDMSEKSWLLDGVIIKDRTYEMFNKVLDIDAKGHKKWKKYIKRKMKLYNRYMSKTYKGNGDASKWTGGNTGDYEFKKLASGAVLRARVVAARKRPPRKPPSPPPKPPTPPPSPPPVRRKKRSIPNFSPSGLVTEKDFRDQLESNLKERDRVSNDDSAYADKIRDEVRKANIYIRKQITRIVKEKERNQKEAQANATAPADASPVELRPSDSQGAVEPNVISPPPPPEPVVRSIDEEFGAKSGQDAMAFIERFNLKDRLITPDNIKEWFDETTGDDFYDATLYYKTKDAKVIQFVIACVEGPPELVKKQKKDPEKTMELIEIHNLNKREGGSIKPFVIKVLKDGKFSGVNMVYLSPADQGLQNDLYEDQWGLDCEKIDENNWCWAKKQDLIKSLARKFITIGGGFRKNKLTIGDKTYVKVMVGAQPNETRKDIADLLMKDNGEHVAKLYPLEFLKSRKVFSLNGQFIKMKIGAKGIEGDDDNIYVSEYAGEPIIYNKPSFDDLLEQTTSGLAALHREGIIHGDIRKKNIVYDGNKITIVSFDRAILRTDEVDNPITENNIWPPKTYIGDDNFKIDKWALALTLLDYMGGFNKDVKNLLFGKEGLMFVGGDIDDAVAITEKRKPVIEGSGLDDLLKYIFFIFAKDSDVSNTAAAMDSFLPGVLMPSSTPRERDINNQKGNDNTNWIDKMLNNARLGNSDAAMATNWVKGHKRLLETQKTVKSLNKQWYPPKVAKIKDPSLKRGYRKTGVSPNIDLGELLYGLTTKQVVKIFDMFASSGAVSVIRAPVRNSYLDYDSFSDAELNELEAELDMYTDDEFDRMMEGAVTGMGKDDLSYDSMSDSSLPSSNAVSYNSSSDAAYSYDSSSDGGLSGLAASYNSESEQSYQNSEHDASYDSESDEDS